MTFPRHQNLTKGVIMGDCNARVGKYQNMDILEENIVDPCLLRDSKDCIVTNYGRTLMHMLDCTNLIVLNGIKGFPLTNVLTCLPTSSGGSLVDYVLMKAYDLSNVMVNAFKIGSLSLDSNHKLVYLDITLSHSINKM